jgi:predicted Zn finger-like uncharacterized protein
MSDTITCPSCRRTLRVPESLRGQLVKCPTCEETFTAAADGAPPPRPAPPPPPPRYDEDEPRPRRARRDDWDDRDDDYDRPRRREKPGKVQAIAIMTLVGGIMATLASVGLLMYFGLVGIASMGFGLVCCLWPGPYYGLVVGIMGIVKGSQLLGENAHRCEPPTTVAVMQIINVINGDFVNLTLGILTLVFLSEPEVKRFFRR